MDEERYIPGICNIGREEIRKRKLIGFIGLVFTIVTLFIITYYNSPIHIKLLVIIPAVVSSIGYLQAKVHFCIFYGWAAFFNFDSLGKKTKVEIDKYKILDKKKSILILLYSLSIGLIIGLVALII